MVNKYAHLSSPQAELDFHERGLLTKSEIIKTLDTFIEDSHKKGLRRILVITGKGLHSQNKEAVIKPLALAHLKSHPKISQALLARRDRGGAGAIEATLN